MTVIRLRRGTAAENPVLAEGEPGWDTANEILKIGDGTTAWNDLGVLHSGTYAPALGRKTGKWYFTPRGTQTTLALTDGRCYFVPFDVEKTTSIDRLGIDVTSAGAATSVVRLGIYQSDGTGSPGTLLLDAGTVDTSATGQKAATVSQSLSPARYWLAVCAQGGVAVPTINATSAVNDPTVWSNNQADDYGASLYQAAVAGALPGTAAPTSSVGVAVMVAVRIA